MIYNSHYLLIFIFAMNAHLRELLGSVMFSPSIIVAEVLLKCSLQEDPFIEASEGSTGFVTGDVIEYVPKVSW